MGTLATANAITGANAKAANSKLIGEVFSQTVIAASMTKDAFGEMEGAKGSRAVFEIDTDLAKTKGDTLNFPVVGGAGKMPRRGAQTLLGKEEKIRLNNFQVKLDLVRHAFATDEKLRRFMAAYGSFEAAIAMLTADHFGRFKETDMKMTLLKGATDVNTVLPNGKGSINELLSTDTASPGLFDDAKSALTGLGAKEIDIRKNKVGADILRYIFFGTQKGFSPLKTNSTYLAALQSAGERGDMNTIFAGGFVDWDGCGIKHQNIVNADADGPTGDPLELREFIGAAITASNSTFAIVGGGLAGPTSDSGYFRWFEGFDYLFTEDQAAATPDSTTYYLGIYNVTGADRGKFGIYSYVGSANTSEQITITNRLRASASGAAVTSLAGITWDSSKHTDAHPQGSIVFQINAKCVPYTRILGFGATAAIRGYGSLGEKGPNAFKPITNKEDYENVIGTGYMGCFGQAVTKDTQNQPRNYVVMPVAYIPQGVKNLPVVTS